MLHCFNHVTIASKQQVIAPKVFTRSVSLPSGTATEWRVSPTSIPAAFGFTNCISTMFLLFGFFDVFLLIVFRFKIKSSLPAGFTSLFFYKTSTGQLETQDAVQNHTIK